MKKKNATENVFVVRSSVRDLKNITMLFFGYTSSIWTLKQENRARTLSTTQLICVHLKILSDLHLKSF